RAQKNWMCWIVQVERIESTGMNGITDFSADKDAAILSNGGLSRTAHRKGAIRHRDGEEAVIGDCIQVIPREHKVAHSVCYRYWIDRQATCQIDHENRSRVEPDVGDACIRCDRPRSRQRELCIDVRRSGR